MKKIKMILFGAVLFVMAPLLSAPAFAAEGTAAVEKINKAINSSVWNCMLFAILGAGLLMTVIIGGFQFRRFGYWWKNSIGSIIRRKDVRKTDDEKSISQFQSLCAALSATVGTGNIAGVATAIVSGGPGSIFWMWVAAVLGLATRFAETVLGLYYRRRNPDGEWSGGAMYYLKDGIGSKKGMRSVGKMLAALFALFAVIASFGIGNMSQVNSIAVNINSTLISLGVKDGTLFGLSSINLIAGLIIMTVSAVVILGGLKRVAATAEKLVPFMAIFYILGAFILIFWDAELIIPAIRSIFRFAFNGKAVAGGALGTVIKWGLKRGVFSNEAGLGSSVMVHSNSNACEPVAQGMWGIFEVFADTLIICTLTAMSILTSGLVDLDTGKLLDPTITDTALTGRCFAAVFGNVGSVFVTVALILFAFSTILGWSHYGAKSWEYLFGTKSTVIYRLLFIAAIALGAVMKSSLAWDISDTFNGLMALPNLIGLVACSGTVLAITKNYNRRVFKGEDIEPMLSFDPEIQAAHMAAAAVEKEG